MVETVPPRPLMASSLSVEHDDAVEIEAYSSGLASVSVCIRFRPAQDGRSSKDTGPWQLGNNGVVLDNPERREWGGYTSVLGPESTQAEVYEHVRPVVQNAVEGVSGVIFAYGQTSAGKTHTMSGHREAPAQGVFKVPVAGIIPRVLQEVFKEASMRQEEWEYRVTMSYVELYKEALHDLLADCRQVGIREHGEAEGFVLEGTMEPKVDSFKEAASWLAYGERSRHVASTQMNHQSSRSHCILRVFVESKPKDGSGIVRTSELDLVDLAGSEKGRTRASDNPGRLVEGCYINRSLLTLGMVVRALATGSDNAHVPYRDSRLTRMLQTALNGRCKIAVIACAAPEERHEDETRSTLHFAANCTLVKTRPRLNEEMEPSSLESLTKVLNENGLLKERLGQAEDRIRELERAKPSSGNGENDDNEIVEELMRENSRLQQRLSEALRKLNEAQPSSSKGGEEKSVQAGSQQESKGCSLRLELENERRAREEAEERLNTVRRYEDDLVDEIHRLRRELHLERCGNKMGQRDESQRAGSSSSDDTANRRRSECQKEGDGRGFISWRPKGSANTQRASSGGSRPVDNDALEDALADMGIDRASDSDLA